MEVTVIIPCHNQGATLRRAVESALEANKIIIVNDASTDDTNFIGMALEDEYQHVYLIDGRSLVPAGVCHVRNLGISLYSRSTDLILPLDADDALFPGAIQTFADHWDENCFVYSGWEERYDDGTFRVVSPPHIGMLNRKSIAHSTFLFSRADWQAVGGYHPDFNIGAEDYAFMCALVNAGKTAIRIDQPLYQYTVSETGRAAKCQRRWASIQALLREHYPDVFKNAFPVTQPTP